MSGITEVPVKEAVEQVCAQAFLAEDERELVHALRGANREVMDVSEAVWHLKHEATRIAWCDTPYGCILCTESDNGITMFDEVVCPDTESN